MRRQSENNSVLKQRQDELSQKRFSALQLRLKEKSDLTKDQHEKLQAHLESIRNHDRAESAERRRRKDEELTWFKAKVNIQLKSEEHTQRKKTIMNGKFEQSIEAKREKVDSLTRKRQELSKSRQEQRRLESAIRSHSREKHIKRVVSRSGSQHETRRSTVLTKIT
jgi:hypothetical protein